MLDELGSGGTWSSVSEVACVGTVEHLCVAADWKHVRGPPQHGLSSQDDGPDHLGMRCNAFFWASNGPNHLGLCAPQVSGATDCSIHIWNVEHQVSRTAYSCNPYGQSLLQL